MSKAEQLYSIIEDLDKKLITTHQAAELILILFEFKFEKKT